MAASSSSSRKLVLKCSDGEEFEIEEAVALQSQTIKHMIEDDCADNIPLPNVTGPILSKVIAYCKRHVDGDDFDSEDEFVKDLKADITALMDLILAANYLHIKGLLDLTCKTVADMIKGKTAEEIRALLKIKNDFTPEEEKAVREENAWAFD